MPGDAMAVAVLGASPNPERYSNKAIRLLKEHGYRVVPIHPLHKEIEGVPVSKKLSDISEPIHTLTLYVGPARGEAMAPDILALKPQRVIMNPGAESDTLEDQLSQAGIRCIRACTLVLLRTGQFETA